MDGCRGATRAHAAQVMPLRASQDMMRALGGGTGCADSLSITHGRGKM